MTVRCLLCGRVDPLAEMTTFLDDNRDKQTWCAAAIGCAAIVMLQHAYSRQRIGFGSPGLRLQGTDTPDRGGEL